MVIVKQRHQVRVKKGTGKSTEPQRPGFMSGDREVAPGSVGDQQAWGPLGASGFLVLRGQRLLCLGSAFS